MQKLLLFLSVLFLLTLPGCTDNVNQVEPAAISADTPASAAESGDESTDGTKYGHLIKKEDALVRKGHFVDSIFSSYDNLGIDLHVNYHCMTEPLFMVKEPHAHPTYEILGFIGGNPLDIRDFGGEVELTLGDEKHIINSTCFVVIPPGLPHCPLNFKTVDRPFMFMVILTMGKYAVLPDEAPVVDPETGVPPPPP